VIVQDRSQCLKRMSTTPAVGMLAGMTMTNRSAAGPRIIAFRLPYRSAPGLPRAKAFAPSVPKPGCPAGRRFSAGSRATRNFAMPMTLAFFCSAIFGWTSVFRRTDLGLPWKRGFDCLRQWGKRSLVNPGSGSRLVQCCSTRSDLRAADSVPLWQNPTSILGTVRQPPAGGYAARRAAENR
jgi:hypothetical protein